MVLEEVGGDGTFEEQQEAILKRWGAEKLVEDSFKKTAQYDDLVEEQQQQAKSNASALFSKQDIELKTELNFAEVMTVSKFLFIAQRYELNGVDDFIGNLLSLKVSLNRRGRGEFIAGLHAEERKEQGRDLGPLTSALSRVGL